MKYKYFVSVFCSAILFTGAFFANASTVHITDDWLNLYVVDTSTWEAVKSGQTSITMTDIAFDSSGNLYGLGGSSAGLYSIDTQNTESTRIGTGSIAGGNALTFSPSGDLYAAEIWQHVFSINVDDGTNSQLPGVLPKKSSGDLEFDSSGNLYMSGYGGVSGGDQLIMVTGTSSTVGGALIGWFGVHDMHGLAYVDDTMYGFSGQSVYSIDLETGAATDLGTISGMDEGTKATGASTDPTQVPEPISALLLGSALITLTGIKLIRPEARQLIPNQENRAGRAVFKWMT